MIDRAASNPPVTSNNLDSSDSKQSNGGDDDGDDDDDTEDTAAVAAVAAGTAAALEATSDADSAPKKKTKDKKRRASFSGSSVGTMSVIEAETKAMFAMSKSTSEARLKHTKQHDKAMLLLEERKLRLQEEEAKRIRESTDWDSKSKELDYKFQLLTKYHKMKKVGMNDDQILSLVPELQRVIDSLNKKPAAKRPREEPESIDSDDDLDVIDSPAKRTRSHDK